MNILKHLKFDKVHRIPYCKHKLGLRQNKGKIDYLAQPAFLVSVD